MIELVALITSCAPGIDPLTLAAIVVHESGANPNAIHLNGAYRLDRQPTNVHEARQVLERLADGRYGSYDVGLAQINSYHLPRLGLEAAALLNPCLNVQVAARVLSDCFERSAERYRTGNGNKDDTRSAQHRLGRALSCYNTGRFQAGFRNGYVARVYATAQRLASATASIRGTPGNGPQVTPLPRGVDLPTTRHEDRRP